MYSSIYEVCKLFPGSFHMQLALFLGPTQVSALQAMESWPGPRNKASCEQHGYSAVVTMQPHRSHFTVIYNYKLVRNIVA